MKIPVIKGLIERRILINYRVEPERLINVLPQPFKPKLVDGFGIAGICLIRLQQIRPKGIPAFAGISSENAAHRIAVEWDENGVVREGVYIPRRDTNSIFNHLTGGRVFPGKHFLSDFRVKEKDSTYEIDIIHKGTSYISVKAKESSCLNPDSIFKNIDNASEFFQSGSIGFSPNKKGIDGLTLKTQQWKVEPLSVERVQSAFFEDNKAFPQGSVTFDNALIMHNISHEWCNYEV